ncbi:MAG: DUF1467 family protein [Pseudomonadota bacterium]
MGVTLSIAVFFIIWWAVLFAVLPFGMRTQDEDGEVVPGTPGSAPSNPNMLRIFAINTVVAAVVFAGVWTSIEYGYITIDTFNVPEYLRDKTKL